MRIPSGVTDQGIYFVGVDATDFTTRETGLASFTVVRSRNGAADATYTTPTITEIDSSTMPGVYFLLLDEDMDIDSGNDSEEVCLHITHAGMAPVTRTFELYRPKFTAGATLAVSDINAQVLDVLNTDTFAEPTGVPAATNTLVNKLSFLYMALRNKLTVTSTKMTFFDDGDNAEWEKDLSDDGTTYTESEANSL